MATYVYYKIQHRVTRKRPPSDKVWTVVDDPEWRDSAHDYFGGYFNPLRFVTSVRPVNPQAFRDSLGVKAITGHEGWWRKRHAVDAMRRTAAADKKGAFNAVHSSGYLACGYRHEFRVVKVTVTQTTEVVSCEKKSKRRKRVR